MRNFLGHSAVLLILFTTAADSQKCNFKFENGTQLSPDMIKFGLNLEDIADTDQPGKSLITLIGEDVTGITSITTDSTSGLFYMNVELQQTSIVVKLTDDFVHFEEYETKLRIYITVDFQCTSGTEKLEIYQPIVDTNNHDPEFLGAPYNYTLPMPFPNNFRVDLFGAISARDIDISNKRILFSVDADDPVSKVLEASYLVTDSDDKKKHYAQLITKAVLNYATDVTFRIFATDTGEPPRTTNTTVTIHVDRSNSILKFAQPVYVADCSDLRPEDADGLVLNFREGNVTVNGGADSVVNYAVTDIQGDYSKNFNLNTSPDYKTVALILVNPPPSLFDEPFILLKLTAKRPGEEESTVLHITLPGSQTQTTPTSTPDVTPESCQSEEHDDCSYCTTAITVLAVALTFVTVGLIASVVFAKRMRNLPESEKVNGVTVVDEPKEEMTEIQRANTDSTPSEPPRRSVAFNDTVEEIKVARL